MQITFLKIKDKSINGIIYIEIKNSLGFIEFNPLTKATKYIKNYNKKTTIFSKNGIHSNNPRILISSINKSIADSFKKAYKINNKIASIEKINALNEANLELDNRRKIISQKVLNGDLNSKGLLLDAFKSDAIFQALTKRVNELTLLRQRIC